MANHALQSKACNGADSIPPMYQCTELPKEHCAQTGYGWSLPVHASPAALDQATTNQMHQFCMQQGSQPEFAWVYINADPRSQDAFYSSDPGMYAANMCIPRRLGQSASTDMQFSVGQADLWANPTTPFGMPYLYPGQEMS